MICKKCKETTKIVLHAFDLTYCEKCGVEIQSGNIPGDKVCPKCSIEHNLCQECGNKRGDNREV